MAHGFDIGVVIKAILKKVFQAKIPLVLYTDSKSLYNCIVKLGTTHKKRLMINVISFCQSYKRRETIEIKWIHGHNNLVDSMTKSKLSSVLKTLIDTNRIKLDINKWVE